MHQLGLKWTSIAELHATQWKYPSVCLDRLLVAPPAERKRLVTSLCWFASIHFYLRLSQDFVFYRKRHPFQDLFCSTSTAPVASGIAAPPLACHWRFAKLPADQLTLQGNRDSNSYSCHKD